MLNISLLLALLVIVGLLIWKGGVSWYKALPILLLGFCLASTQAAGTIQGGLTAVADMIGRIPV